MIVRVEKDSFRVLDQNGSVRTIKEQEITSKRVSKHAIAQDAHRNSIKQGDLVTILQGPNQVCFFFFFFFFAQIKLQ